MSTDTPRTDAVLLYPDGHPNLEPRVFSSFARQLERKLAKANDLITEVPTIARERDKLHAENERLREAIKDALESDELDDIRETDPVATLRYAITKEEPK